MATVLVTYFILAVLGGLLADRYGQRGPRPTRGRHRAGRGKSKPH